MINKIMPRYNPKGLKGSLEYIKNDEKTLSKEDEYINASITGSLQYIENEEKVKAKYVTGIKCNVETAAFEFQYNNERVTAKAGTTVSGITYYHDIQSIPAELSPFISDEEAHQCGVELATKTGHQCVVATHVNSVKDDDNVEHGKYKHSHIIMNAYRYYDDIDFKNETQMKWYDTPITKEQLKRWNDQIALAHGMSIIIEPSQNGAYYSIHESKIDSWKAKIRENVEQVYNDKNVKTLKSFVKTLETKYNYEVQTSDYNITIKTPEEKIIRLKKLGPQYTNESLKKHYSLVEKIASKLESKQKPKTDELDKIIQKNGTNLFVSCDYDRMDGQGTYKIAFDLNSSKYKVLAECYVETDKVYEILIKDKEQFKLVGACTGEDIMCYYKAKNDIEKGENHYIQEIEKLKQEREYKMYWYDYKRNKYNYYDPFYNLENKSNLELIFILAMLLMGKYDDYFTQPPKRVCYFKNYELQSRIDALELSQKENIKSPAELQNKIKTCGKKNGFIRREIKSYEKALNNMQPLKDAIDYLNSFDSVGNTEEINQCKELLHNANLIDKDKQLDFLSRYDNITAKKNACDARFKESKKRYRTLKKLEAQMNRAILEAHYNQVHVEIERSSLDDNIKDVNYNKNADTTTNTHKYNDIYNDKHKDEYER